MNRSIQNYQNILKEQGLGLELLEKGEVDLERVITFFNKINSKYFSSHPQMLSFQIYAEKLINNAFNFMVVDKNCDIGFFSIYANDFINKTAFLSAMGILPDFQGRRISSIMTEFYFEFLREIGMEYVRCEVNKNNTKSVRVISKYYEIESETEHDSYIWVRDLR